MNRAVLARRAAAVAAVAAGCVLAGAPAFADAAAPLHYTVDFSQTTFSPGDGAGSTIVGSGAVRDDNGVQIGIAEDACTVVSAARNGDDTVQCTVTLKLQDGQLEISTLGLLDPAAVHESFEGTVQGGTGAYDGARGEAAINSVAPALYDVVITLK